MTGRDDTYFEILASSIRVCADYKPKFGTSQSVSAEQFQARYAADPFYNWVGLASPGIYAAHKASGGITSLYRQLGIGGERLFRRVVSDQLGLTEKQANWNYTIPGQGGKDRVLSLDARIEFDDVANSAANERLSKWRSEVTTHLKLDKEFQDTMKGVVFEVRQGYKSADSKRQNADVANASNAYAKQYVPSIALLSTQINEAVATRYLAARWLLLTGTLEGSAVTSLYVFCREVLDYDLAEFFRRNSDRFQEVVHGVVDSLLKADADAN